MSAMPSMSGILRSETMASGSDSASRASASAPQEATSTSNPSSDEVRPRHLAGAGIVVHDEDEPLGARLAHGLTRPPSAGAGRGGLGARCGAPGTGWPPPCRRPRAAPSAKRARCCSTARVHHDQPEAGAGRLGRDERAEHLLELVGRDPAAAVAHLHHDGALAARGLVAARELHRLARRPRRRRSGAGSRAPR